MLTEPHNQAVTLPSHNLASLNEPLGADVLIYTPAFSLRVRTTLQHQIRGVT
jgi:hypothetical protein